MHPADGVTVTQPPAGLCADCIHAKLIRSSHGSEFVQCELSFSDPRFPKYPRLPVLKCRGHKPNRS